MAKNKFSENSLRLKCKECKRSNYTTRKNRKLVERKLEYLKYCPHCRKHTIHRESKMTSG